MSIEQIFKKTHLILHAIIIKILLVFNRVEGK